MNKNLKSISSILEDVFKKKKSPLSEGYFLHQLNQAWEDVAGKEIARISQPTGFKNKRLMVSLPSSSHMQDMHFMKEMLKDKINKRFPSEDIKNIQFFVEPRDKKINFNPFKKS